MQPLQSLQCPNHTSLDLFDTELDICIHLSVMNSAYLQWTTQYMGGLDQINMAEHDQVTQDIEYEEYGM